MSIGMRPIPHSRPALTLAVLCCFLCLSGAPANAAATQTPPEDGVEQIDLSAAQPAQTIAPFATYALPSEEFPDAVVVDLPRSKTYASTEFMAVNIFSLLAAGWLEVIALLSSVVLLVWLRRAIRRPQQVGKFYCRRCNYELTNLVGEICPECGAPVAGPGRMRGRRRWPRVALTSALLVVVIAGYAVSCRRAPRLVWPARWPAWWSRSLDDVAEANAKYPWLIQHSRVLSRLVEIDLAGDGATRTIVTASHPETDHITALFLSDDGQRLTVWRNAALEIWRLPEWRIEKSIDLATVFAAERLVACDEIASSADGQRVLILGRGWDERKSGGIAHVALLLDVQSGKTLWRIEDFAGEDLASIRVLHQGDFRRFLIAGDVQATGQTVLSEWYVEGDMPVRIRHFDTSAYVLGPRLARNGFGNLLWASNFQTLEAWNLQTERMVQRISLPTSVALVTAWTSAHPRLIVTMLDTESTVWIIDTRARAVLAQLAEAPPRTRGTEVLSDGTTVALWGYNEHLANKVVHLYDLSSLAAGPSDESDR